MVSVYQRRKDKVSAQNKRLSLSVLQLLRTRRRFIHVVPHNHATPGHLTALYIHSYKVLCVMNGKGIHARSLTLTSGHVKGSNCGVIITIALRAHRISLHHPVLQSDGQGLHVATLTMQPPKFSRAHDVSHTPRTKVLRLLLLLVVIALSLWLVSVREHAAKLSQFGYPGIMLINAITSGTVLIPMPGVIVTYTLGGVFNPLLVALAAAAGAALGELSGYAAGVSGQAVVGNMHLYNRMLARMRQHTRATMLVLVIMAAIPNPAFDLVGIAAGTLRVPLLRFFLSAFAGNLVKMLAFAYAGAYSFSWLLPAG